VFFLETMNKMVVLKWLQFNGYVSTYIMFSIFFSVLRFELRAYTLSHSTSPFFVKGFFSIGSCELFAQAANSLASNLDPP
jgi:hypothetical protein